MRTVLEERHRRFMQRLQGFEPAHPLGDLFGQLRQWLGLGEHDARGCMLLRARSEYADASARIMSLVRNQKNEFQREIARRVSLGLGREHTTLNVQIWLLFEGATAAASVSETSVAIEAKQAASALLAKVRERNK